MPWVLATAGFALWAGGLRTEGRLRGRLAARAAVIAQLSRTADSLRGLVAGGTARVDTLIRDRWQPARLRVDTLPDTVRVPVPVVRDLVAAADTTIRACRVTLTDCERLAAAERARADSLGAQLRDTRRLGAPRLSRWLELVTDGRHGYVGAGIGARLPLGLSGVLRADLRLDSTAVTVRAGVRHSF